MMRLLNSGILNVTKNRSENRMTIDVGIARTIDVSGEKIAISPEKMQKTMSNGIIAKIPAKINSVNPERAFPKNLNLAVYLNIFIFISDTRGMNTIRPMVAANDIQNPGSITAPGEKNIMTDPAAKSEVRVSL